MRMPPAASSSPVVAGPPRQPLFSAAARRRVLLTMLLFFGGGVLAHGWPLLRPLALALTTPLLLLTNGAVLLAVLDDERAPALRVWSVAAWSVTVILEIVGVATGRVFGAYHYGSALGGQVAGVPLLIGLNWITLLLGGLALTERALPAQLPGRRWLVAAAAALLLTAFDWVMEPVAVRLGYWFWEGGPAAGGEHLPAPLHVPLQNYLAWLLIGLGLAGALAARRVRVRTGLAGAYFGIQLVFFGLLRWLLPLFD